MVHPFGRVPHRIFNRGEVIFRQGDDGNGECYLVHEGRIEVRKTVDGNEHVLQILAKGDLLGEVALFRNAPHSATAVAAERVTLLVISADRLESMVRRHPGLAIALIKQLARMAAGDDSIEGPRASSWSR
ncbi:MAG TPA: cyclic nucleotide-binding domain-containing protein [Candidatus Methylomirabilis sp.]|nr:cyclic nucleotide-binding domain-containing protein [Candidatus Methylomirabilis sp.]